MNSMTGFGQAANHKGVIQVEASIRTYNGRHLELKMNLPETQEYLRDVVDKKIRNHFSRGSFHIKVSAQMTSKGEVSAAKERLKFLVAEYLELKSFFKKATKGEDLTFTEFLKLDSGLKKPAGAGDEPDKNLEELISKTLDAAIKELSMSRTKEGAGIKKILEQQIKEMMELREQLSDAAKDIEMANKERILETAAGSGLFDKADHVRVQQEILFLLDKQSVVEELSRLQLHFKAIKELLQSNLAVGKKLEFYGQELLREVNTVGSKIQSGSATELVVNFKAAIENFREQVQNVE